MPGVHDIGDNLGSRHFAHLRPVPAAAHRPADDRQRGRQLDQHAASHGHHRTVVRRPLARHLVPQGFRQQPRGRHVGLRHQHRAGLAAGLCAVPRRAARRQPGGAHRERHAGGGAGHHAGLRLHDRVQHRPRALAGLDAAADSRARAPHPALPHHPAADRPAPPRPRPARAGGGHARRLGLAAVHRHRAAEPAPEPDQRAGDGGGHLGGRVRRVEPAHELPEPHLPRGAAAGLLRRHGLRLRGHGDPSCAGERVGASFLFPREATRQTDTP